MRKADLTAAEEQLKTLGVDKNHPSSVVNVYAPISGVIVAQNVTQCGSCRASICPAPRRRSRLPI
jgi:membrane fusion protein, heavy metal efflux system